ncbi:uncharacterized protein F4812DRAFT_468688 [Daldinia caldariorum]|uniref:uncharacterized protein n=1 Tax=Daldinia caldariorum TaxID=326644 RepID=UPI0020079331|nr:uncharacterized protein F4812DRAFT_468688 [Daldinia caldariorum]KAI1463357.1 hypothetical protein F4812DRAFT_468688 [Daldinia caldariorum]
MSFPPSKEFQAIPWEKGMRLGPGRRFPDTFLDRLGEIKVKTGSGTVEDPLVLWPLPGPWTSRGHRQSVIMDIVKQTTSDCGLSHAWIASDIHPTCTTGWKDGKRQIDKDDYHVTVRMGSNSRTCNIHGHIYLICEGNDMRRNIVRAMKTSERGIVGGTSPQLLVWGPYDPSWPRAKTPLPEPPYKVKKDSILEFQNKARAEAAAAANASNRKR